MTKRVLKDGTEVPALDQPVVLNIKTKCPGKWLLIDRETGEAYVPYDTPGTMQWKKLYNAEWDINA
jgi:hypothetical protein